MTKRPNICYIFEKLGVQGCQIWHSHVSMPFNLAPAHSTRPHNAKKALYVIISAEIPENLVHKSYCIKVIFDDAVNFFVSPCQVVPGACLSQIVPNSATSNTHKHPKTPTNTHKTPTNTHKEWCYHTFVKEWMKALDKTRILAPSDYFYHFSFPRYGRLKSKFLCERYSHCIFSSCSIDLTKTRYTWSLTAVQ